MVSVPAERRRTDERVVVGRCEVRRALNDRA